MSVVKAFRRLVVRGANVGRVGGRAVPVAPTAARSLSLGLLPWFALLAVAAGCDKGVYLGELDPGLDPARLTFLSVAVPEESGDEYTLLVSATEVSQRVYRARTGDDPSFFRNCEDCPVETVSWYDAVAFANALSREEGLPECYRLEGCSELPPYDREASVGDRHAHPAGLVCERAESLGPRCPGYRLPTVAEYRHFGEVDAIELSLRCLSRQARFAANSHGMPGIVGARRPNLHGLFDTVGNVDEWLEDARPTPRDADEEQAREARWHALAGSSFDTRLRDLRGAPEALAPASWGQSTVGFRLVRTLLPAAETSTASP